MKISSINMVNFRSHSATTVEAPSGLVAIVGATGAGKSNVIRALEFLVTGAVHGVAKEDLLRWGASSGHVTGTIETDDTKVEIYRSVSSSSARLYINGKETATGIRDVNAEMLKRFGVDKDVAKFVFTGQGEIDGLLFDPPAQRETAVLKLCGMSDATTVHKVLGECMPLLAGAQNSHELQGQLTSMLAEVDANIAALSASVASSAARPDDAACDTYAKLRVLVCAAATELRALKARAATAEEAKAATAAALARTPSAGGDKSELLTKLAHAEKEVRHRGAKEALASCQAVHSKWQAELARVEAEIVVVANGIPAATFRASAEDLLAQYKLCLQQHNACDAYAAGLARAGERMEAILGAGTAKPAECARLLRQDENGAPRSVRLGVELSEAISDIEKQLSSQTAKLQEDASKLSTQLSVLRSAKIEDRQALLSSLSTSASVECPTCVSQVGRDRIPAIQAKIAGAGAEEQALHQAALRATTALHDHNSYALSLLAALRAVERMVANLGPVPETPPVPRAEVVEAVSAINERLEKLQKLSADEHVARTSASLFAGSLRSAVLNADANVAVPELASVSDDALRTLLRDLPAQIREIDRLAEAMATARRNDDMATATLAAARDAVGRRATSAAAELPADLWNMLTIDAQGAALATWVSTQTRNEDELDRRRKALIGFEAQLSAAQTQKKTLVAKLAAVTAQMAQDAPRQKLVEDVTKIRDWFHYGSGPKRVAIGIMARMTHGVNELLQYMQAPFSVTLRGLEYRVHFMDGRTDALPDGADASQLSGGQRVLLSIAVHFARYRMFASKLGILVLDEPTVYLDPASVASVCDALDKVRQLAHKLGMQIWLCTHEPVLLPVCDHVVTISGNA